MANVYDGSAFQDQVDDPTDETVVFSDTGFEKRDRHPTDLRVCKRGERNAGSLVHKLVANRVRPYYLYQCDLSEGLTRFRTPVGKGIEIMEILPGD